MNKAKALKKGDKVAIVSLSSGMLGEEFCSHNLEIGTRRLKEYGLVPVFMPHALSGIQYVEDHPEARAADLKAAFMDDSIKGIICAIGGDDSYRLLPYLMEDSEFIQAVQDHPKLFTGFSDTTISHLMLYQLGLETFYGPSFITDIAEISNKMLPYTQKAFEQYFEGVEQLPVVSSDVWYEERTDFSRNAMGTDRVAHKEAHGYEILKGSGSFRGELLGGCLESFHDILTGQRYADEKEVCAAYSLFPSKEKWKGKILFTETCEEKPEPDLFREEIELLKEKGIFDAVNGVIFGKPQDEQYYEEYKQIIKEVLADVDVPVLFNVNFGHAAPRWILPYGMDTIVDMEQKTITFQEPLFCSNVAL